VVCSLIETAKLKGIESYAYLRDVLERMVSRRPNNRLDEFLLRNWALNHRATA